MHFVTMGSLLAMLCHLASIVQGSRVRLLIVLVPGFGLGVCLAFRRRVRGAARVPGCAPAPTAPGRCSFRVGGIVRTGQASVGKAHSRCQQVRKACFHGQSGLILRIRLRACRTSLAGVCQIR